MLVVTKRIPLGIYHDRRLNNLREINRELFLGLGRAMISIPERPTAEFKIGNDFLIISRWKKDGQDHFTICETVKDIQQIFVDAEKILVWYKTPKVSREMTKILMAVNSDVKPGGLKIAR